MIQLDERYRIITDSSKQNFILEQLQDIKDKKTEIIKQEWVNVGYYGNNFTSALNRYVNEKIKDVDGDVKELINLLNKLSKHIKDIVKQAGITLGTNNE